MGEIINFPDVNPDQVKIPRTIDDVDENIENVQLYHIAETIDTILPIIFHTLTASGFDLSQNEDIKNGALLVEALRSVLCQFYGIPHPLQEVAETLFIAEKEGILSMNKSVHIDFKKTSEET